MERKEYLLHAAYNYLNRLEERPDAISVLGQTIIYDDAECDGYCLKEDIAAELDIINY